MKTRLLRTCGLGVLAASAIFAASLASAREVIPLYQGTPPGAKPANRPEKEYFSKLWNTEVVDLQGFLKK